MRTVPTRHGVVPDLLLRDPRANTKERALRCPRPTVTSRVGPLNPGLDGYDALVLHVQLVALPVRAQGALGHGERQGRRRADQQQGDERTQAKRSHRRALNLLFKARTSEFESCVACLSRTWTP